jgi:hypothetical protein
MQTHVIPKVICITAKGNRGVKESELNVMYKIRLILYTDKCGNSVFAVFRYLLIECEDQEPAVKQDSKVREMYLTVMKTFSQVGYIFINKKLGVSFLGSRFGPVLNWLITQRTITFVVLLQLENINCLFTVFKLQR